MSHKLNKSCVHSESCDYFNLWEIYCVVWVYWSSISISQGEFWEEKSIISYKGPKTSLVLFLENVFLKGKWRTQNSRLGVVSPRRVHPEVFKQVDCVCYLLNVFTQKWALHRDILTSKLSFWSQQAAKAAMSKFFSGLHVVHIQIHWSQHKNSVGNLFG